MATEKPIHTAVLDAGPIIRGEPSPSSLLMQCERIVSTPAVMSEIRDEHTRQRLQNTLMPFLVLLSPKPESVRLMTEFARRTGDLSVLSQTDIQVLALAYELDCERNCGDSRLRSTPGQKQKRGEKPTEQSPAELPRAESKRVEDRGLEDHQSSGPSPSDISEEAVSTVHRAETPTTDLTPAGSQPLTKIKPDKTSSEGMSQPLFQIEGKNARHRAQMAPAADGLATEEQLSSLLGTTRLADDSERQPLFEGPDSDSEGWITPSNINKLQATNQSHASPAPEETIMQVATVTTDFAMQNVLLQMNLNLVSSSLRRVRRINTFVLRCHACFQVVKDMSKQFCPRCGKPSLTRVSCTTNAQGEFRMHFKKNMQWNKRGDRYSIPKPVAGSANGRLAGGGKDGWGTKLILAEDQKEYVRAVSEQKRMKSKDLMDQDYLPAILSGDRHEGGGRPKVGAGRNVNSRKRK